MKKKTWIVVNSDTGEYELVFKCEAVDHDDAYHQWENSPDFKEPDFLIGIFCLRDIITLLGHFNHTAI